MSSQPMTKMDGASKLLVVLVYHASVFGSAPHDLPACRHAPKSNFVFAVSLSVLVKMPLICCEHKVDKYPCVFVL